MRAIEFSTLKSSPQTPLSECLKRLSAGIAEIIGRCQPGAAAIEEAFYSQNVRTALTLGQTRGVAIAVCAERGVPVFEYAPRRVKQAVVGFGAAEKRQVQEMVIRLLSLDAGLSHDASDALAIAICHLHHRTGHAQLMPKAI